METKAILREMVQDAGLSLAEASGRMGYKNRTTLSTKLAQEVKIELLNDVSKVTGHEIRLRKGKDSHLISKDEESSNTREILELIIEKSKKSQTAICIEMGYASKHILSERKIRGITIDFLYKVGKHLGYEMVVKKKGKEYIITKD